MVGTTVCLMSDAADMPTIESILTDFGLDDVLEPDMYQELLAILQNRDSVMILDARKGN